MQDPGDAGAWRYCLDALLRAPHTSHPKLPSYGSSLPPLCYCVTRQAYLAKAVYAIRYITLLLRFTVRVKGLVVKTLKLCPYFTLFSRMCTTTPYLSSAKACTITMGSGTSPHVLRFSGSGHRRERRRLDGVCLPHQRCGDRRKRRRCRFCEPGRRALGLKIEGARWLGQSLRVSGRVIL